MDLEKVTGVRTGVFEKDAELRYIYMSELAAEYAGVPGGVYHPEMAWTDYDLPWSDGTAEGVQAEDREVIATGIPSRSRAIIQDGSGEWRMTVVFKTRTESGGIWGEIVAWPPGSFGRSWAPALDMERKVLNLPGGGHLTKAELDTLRLVAHDTPRKVMADELSVSIKTVEKRLGTIKKKLLAECEDARSLQAALHELELTAFLLDHSDWFSGEGVHKVQK